MAKRNGNGSRNLPAKTPNANSLANLRRGNPGNRGGPGRPDLAVRLRALGVCPKAIDLARAVLEDKETEPRVVDKDLVYATPTNRDKLAAAELLLRTADVMPRAGVTVHAEGPVTVQVWRFGDREIAF